MTETEYQFSMPVRSMGAITQKSARIDSVLSRVVDIFASLFGLILLSPLFLIVALKIRRDTSGPIFYRGRRAARGGGEFSILKFRTMYERPESYQGALVTAIGDDRITPYGHWLRDHKINELPQLWNVLVGDMSLVGPRPEDPEIAAKEWPAEVRAEILSVRPGVTSPSSVLYRDEEKLLNSDDVMQDYLRDILPSKMRLDLLYVRNHNLLTDLDVIFYTFIVLFPSLRKINIPESQLYWGAFSRFATRNLFWFILDSITAVVGISIAGIIWRTEAPLNIGWSNAAFFALGTAMLFGCSNALFGISRISWAKASAGDVVLLSASAVMSTSVLIIVHEFILLLKGVPFGMLIVGGLLSLMGFVVVRYRERLLTGLATRWLNMRGGNATLGERVLIIGAGDGGELATWFLKRGKLARAFSVVGILDDDPRRQGERIASVPVLGTTQSISEWVQKLDVGVIFYAIHNISPIERARILRLCKTTSARIVVLPDVGRRLNFNFSQVDSEDRSTSTQVSYADIDVILSDLEASISAGSQDDTHARLAQLRTAFDSYFSSNPS